MRVKVWGARGSVPAPGPETTRYGGNTSCVTVRLSGRSSACSPVPGCWSPIAATRRAAAPRLVARPMARVIQESIKRPLAEELLFGRLAGGGHAFVTLGADDVLKVEARADSEQALLEGS